MKEVTPGRAPGFALAVKGLERRFGDFRALRDVSFSVPRGALCGLLGPNGAGKTTTLRILAAEIAPTDGEVNVLGHALPGEAHRVRRLMGYVPDSAGFYEELSLEEYLGFFAAFQGMSGDKRKRAVSTAIELARVEALAHRRLRGLSKGERQRILLARALLHDPELYVLDEPADGLDPEGRIELRELLLLMRERGRTILVSSHVLSDLETTCSHFVVINHGRVAFRGTRDELLGVAGGRCRIRIEVLDDAEPLAAWLATRPDLEVLGTEASAVEIDASSRAEDAHELLEALRAMPFRLVSFHRRAPTLEEAYLQLMAAKEEDS